MTHTQITPMTEAMYYVLLALHKPHHGYAIMEAVAKVSQGRIAMGPGTLYGILKRMQKENYISLEHDDGRRKIYQLTAKGELALMQEYQRLQQMVYDGQRLAEESAIDE